MEKDGPEHLTTTAKLDGKNRVAVYKREKITSVGLSRLGPETTV